MFRFQEQDNFISGGKKGKGTPFASHADIVQRKVRRPARAKMRVQFPLSACVIREHGVIGSIPVFQTGGAGSFPVVHFQRKYSFMIPSFTFGLSTALSISCAVREGAVVQWTTQRSWSTDRAGRRDPADAVRARL